MAWPAIRKGLGDMTPPHTLGAAQIGDGSRHSQKALSLGRMKMVSEKELSFNVGVGPNGEHTPFRESEPVFCFVRDTEEQAVQVAIETIQSYLLHFKQISAPVTPRKTAKIPTQRIQRSRRYSVDRMAAVA